MEKKTCIKSATVKKLMI